MDDMTRFENRFEKRVRAFARTGARSVDSAAVARAVAAGHPRSAATGPARRRPGGEIHPTRQRAVFGSWRTRSLFKASLAAAAVVVALVSGAILMGRPIQPVIGGPSPSLGASASPSHPATTPTPSAEASPPAAQSIELTWTKVATDVRPTQVAWLGDRFVLVDEDSGAVRTSTDGVSWQPLQSDEPDPGYVGLLRNSFAIWQDSAVGWWNPEDGPDVTGKPPVTARDILRIVRPPAAPTETTPWKGRIQSIGIGPAGIVAEVHSHLDWDAWVATKLGADWVSRYKAVSFKDGILEIAMKRGRGLKVVWANEGFEPGDYQDAGFGWYSADGRQWTAIPGFPTGFGDVVGVPDGFIARGDDNLASCESSDGCTGMWYSSDGLTWGNIGNLDNGPHGAMLPWQGGALVTDGVGRFDFWTSQGHTELPMAADVRAARKQQVLEQPNASIGTGPLGLVAASMQDQGILVTRDGVDWDIQPMPAEMAASGGRLTPTVAVGERSVLIMLWTGTYEEGYVPSLWVGTPKP